MGNKEQMVKIHQHAMKSQKKALIEKAVTWLFENIYDYFGMTDQAMVESFRKYLEE